MSAPDRRRERAPPVARRLRDIAVLGWPIAVLISIEFLLGMALNLFTALPSAGGPIAILSASPVLIGHFVVAFLILGVLSRATALSIRLGHPRAIGTSVLGLGSGVVATLAGLAFAFGGQAPAASYLMSIGFVGVLFTAVGLLAIGWSSESDPPRRPSEPGAASSGSPP
ncbi:MAG TPA: hypothetical protein VGX00_02225 [Thermoplasmata archaeon]|nr:hypothetical protein [Thermoplasmata archaeon]